MATQEDKTSDWVAYLPMLQAHMNNSATSAGSSPNQIIYGFNVREPIDTALGPHPDYAASKQISAERLMHRNEAIQALALASAKAKEYFDRDHIPLLLSPGDKVFLNLGHGYSQPDQKGKLARRRTGPFKVLERVGRLAYRLEIPEPFGRIHDVVSVTHLEKAPRDADPYGRQPSEPGPIETDGDTDEYKSYEVERITAKRTVKRRGKLTPQYRVKWIGYPDIWNEWYDKEQLSNCMELVEEYEAQHNNSTQDKQDTSRDTEKLDGDTGNAEEAPTKRKRGRPKKITQENSVDKQITLTSEDSPPAESARHAAQREERASRRARNAER